MTMTVNPDGELDSGANPDGEQTGDAALDYLIQRENAKDEPAQQADEPEQDADDAPEKDAETDDTPETVAEVDAWLANKRKITVSGEELEITADEAFKGYMRDADYRQKTERAAELTRAAESERSEIRQERETRVNQLDTLASALYQELVGDQSRLPDLLETDPVAYLRVKQDMERKSQLLQQAGQQRHHLSQQQAADAENEQDAYAKAERAKLSEKLPEWRDPKIKETESHAIAEYLQKLGYSRDEMAMLQDHRALLIARDAMKYRAQQSVKAKQAQPAPVKVVQPGARHQPSQPGDRAAELRRKASRTHSTDDILAYMHSKES